MLFIGLANLQRCTTPSTVRKCGAYFFVGLTHRIPPTLPLRTFLRAANIGKSVE